MTDDDFTEDLDLDRDFARIPAERRLLGHLVTSTSRDTIAYEMGLTPDEIDALVPKAIALAGPTWTSIHGKADAARRLVHETLDSIDRRVYAVLDSAPHTSDRVELLCVLLDVLRFRAELAGVVLPAPKRGKR